MLFTVWGTVQKLKKGLIGLMVMKLVLEMLQSMDTVNFFVLFLFLEVLLVSYIKFKEKLPSNRRTTICS